MAEVRISAGGRRCLVPTSEPLDSLVRDGRKVFQPRRLMSELGLDVHRWEESFPDWRPAAPRSFLLTWGKEKNDVRSGGAIVDFRDHSE
ncbi:Uncharacterised protein [Mycobacteroides abscessus subsp. abscessus]|nr:Uncharacterised protein [Mycobacteroides abscessus subsp. abscessus]SID18970.1 Uncharacterised protein [Mycobacteroides abscessus subsp. abscessus]SKW00666.1 Uncharacterised protein [Mycobacteroides abscessus subsp. abscessus]